MHRMTVLYGTPTDPAAFDEYYQHVHLPLARKMGGLLGWNLTQITSQEGDVANPVYLVADLYTADKGAMTAMLESEQGRAARDDLANFVTGGVTFLSGNETPVDFT